MNRQRRLAIVAIVVAIAAAAPGRAHGALFFFFAPTTVTAGQQATIRTAGTPANFAPLRHGSPIRVYLVRNETAARVKTRFDARLFYIGTLRMDTNGRGILRFTAPPLDSASYAVAAWCPVCATYSRGRKFSTIAVDASIVPRYRPLMLLKVRLPSATETCPVTHPNGSNPPLEVQFRGPNYHGNGALWVSLSSNGTLVERPDRIDPDGTFFEKLIWWADGVTGRLRVTAERLDRVAPTQRSVGISGWSTGFYGSASWASRLHFPPGSCWRITGRVKDVSLVYVMRVVVG